MDPLQDSRLISVLETLENAIDSASEEKLYRDWIEFWEKGVDTGYFSPERENKKKLDPPFVSLNSTFLEGEEGITRMLVREYGGCLSALGGNGQLCVRANYGVGILPSLFGAEYFYMPEEHQQLPNVKALGEEKVKSLLDKGVPDLQNGRGGQVLRVGEYMRKIGERYPKIGKYVWCYHPDLQGPMDVAELLCGSELFYLLADEPQWCHQLLRLITDTYHAFIGAWWERVERKGDYSVHWGWVQKGHVMLRDDSAMNLSPDMIKEYILPYDSEILGTYGGCIHFCGKGDHYLPFYESLPGYYGMNMSQPEYNNMEKIYQHTIDKGIRIIGLPMEQAKIDGERLKGRVMAQ